MKWLKDDSYNAMKQAADNWDKLLNKVLGDNPDMKAEDVTVDQLLDSIESTGNTSDLQEQLSTAQEELKEKDTLIEQLQSDVAELKGPRRPEISRISPISMRMIPSLSWPRLRKQDFLNTKNNGKTRHFRY